MVDSSKLPEVGPPVQGTSPDAASITGRTRVRIEVEGLRALIDALGAAGYEVIAPTVRHDAVVYDPVSTLDELPQGVSDEQGPGHYRLTRPGHDEYFAYAVGPHSWKRELFPSSRRVWIARRSEDGMLRFDTDSADYTRRAFVGVRACEIAGMAIQDRVFTGGTFGDADYAARRRNLAIVAVQCTAPSATCFCASMGTGPRATAGFDIALTEVRGEESGHYFVAECATSLGDRLLAQVPSRAATDGEVAAADARLHAAAGRMGRMVETEGLAEVLHEVYDAPRWNDVAQRCLSCTNCTMACPTCFCATFDDVPSLEGDHSERWRKWDSCFTLEHSYIHGGAVRPSTSARYRQWLTHKFGTWWAQFGSAGCVGCGRCITWCPVGIDITEEIAALRDWDARRKSVSGAHAVVTNASDREE